MHPTPLPQSLGRFKKDQFVGTSSEKGLESPTFSQVSVTSRKSSSFEIKQIAKWMSCLQVILRLPTQRRGVRQWEDLERWSWVTGKIHWYATSSECHETKWPHPSPYWKRSKPSRDGDKRDSLSFSLTAIPPLFTFLLLRFLPWKFRGSRLWQAGTVVKKGGVGYLSMEVSDQCLIKPQ